MPKTMSQKQIEANRRNARQSTGPRTPKGRAVAKMNALKHGILSTQVLVQGPNFSESRREFLELHRRFHDDLQPVGPVEEMLVDQIVTAHWRLRRALMAEAGEISLNIGVGRSDGGRPTHPRLLWMQWEVLGDPVHSMRYSSEGVPVLIFWLEQVRERVEQEGELTEAATKIPLGGKPNRLTEELEELRQQLVSNPAGAEPEALRERNRQEVLEHLDIELGVLRRREARWAENKEAVRQARRVASVLPSLPVMNRVLRYETKLERQMYRAMAQLERMQRLRRGEAVPAPLSVEVSDRSE